ncbi:MAG: hypothetical protein WCY00_02400 [Candidatus Dojkabacteria bacterium]
MIKVLPNKNIIFLTLVLNIANPKEKKKFPLYEKISSKFEKLISKSFWIEFEKEYKNKNPLSTLYQFMILSLYLNDNFVLALSKKEEKELMELKAFRKDISFFRNHLKKLYDDINFNSFYTENIQVEYEKLCNEIQEIFDKKDNILNALVSFWELEYIPELFFIPNFVALGDCFGLRKEDIFYSITSPKVNKSTGESEYHQIHVLSNTIHELSHSFFNETIGSKYPKEKLKEKLKKLSLNKDVLKIYGVAYFGECFVRASTIKLNETLNIYDLRVRGLEEKVENYLLSNENLGYPLVREYYEKLKDRKDENLQEIFDTAIEL